MILLLNQRINEVPRTEAIQTQTNTMNDFQNLKSAVLRELWSVRQVSKTMDWNFLGVFKDRRKRDVSETQ